MKIVVSHPTGNEFSKAAIQGFAGAQLLQSYYTAIASFPGSVLERFGRLRGFSDIRRRSLDPSLSKYVHVRPWKELARLVAIKAGNKALTAHEKGIYSVDKVYADLDNYVAKRLDGEKKHGATAVYAYEDGALLSFRKARELQLKTVYDLPIGYWRTMHQLLEKERDANPEWGMTLTGLKDSTAKLEKKDREIAFADIIIVASSFTKETLNAYPYSLPSVFTVPYGFPEAKKKAYRPINGSKIKLLFVGGLSQRKGLSYLFKALKGLENHVELTVVGRLPGIACEALNAELLKHKYFSSLPHAKILELMREHDVLIFPSLFEGFGQVITEAMAQGTPVITTERTAGPDLIRHGENGWLVKAGSAEAIRNVLEEIIARPGIIGEVGANALKTTEKRPWSVYGEELAKAAMSIDS